MQAPQSYNASDLLKEEVKSGSKLETAFHRGLSSPFSAPVQAAIKYLERQRGEVLEDDVPAPGTAGYAASLYADEHSARGHSGPSQASREQDRRLERSLYEGHSIEAGFDFDAALAGRGDYAASEDRAYLTDGDGTEPLYRYADPGPMVDPDPEVVRGAIFRLANKSQVRHDPFARPGVDPGRSAVSNVPPHKAAESTPQPNFGEVARRVWATSSETSLETGHAGTERVSTEPAVASQTVLKESGLPFAEQSVQGVNPAQMRSSEAAADSTQNRECGSQMQQEALEEVNPARALAASDGIAGEGPALAHDACNLLSALALYSELLGSPGVLSEPHGHYAEELKLMAGRSQLLIGRLHHVVATSEAQLSRRMGSISETNAVAKNIATVMDTSTTLVADAKEGEEKTNLADLLMRWGSLLSVLAHGTLEVVIGSHAAAPIPAGAEALERILVNLVRNARAATVEGGAIRISLAASGAAPVSERSGISGTIQSSYVSHAPGTGQTMVLTVDDSGCGMTEAQVLQILGEETDVRGAGVPREVLASVQAGTADLSAATLREHSRGHGLGLQIVRELVAASHGTLAIQSQLGRGTRIEIRWPVLAYSETGHQSPPSVPAVPPAQAAAPIGAAETLKMSIGPDGYSEAELRAMMLRLHRTSPQERSPFSRRLSGRKPVGLKETGRGFSVVRSRLFYPGSDAYRGPGEEEQENSAHHGSAAKGAIAC